MDFSNDIRFYIIIYVLVINLIGFFIMWWDKRQAKFGNWRVPEKTLFMITIIGGGIGTLTGMYKFRHKTQKLRFVLGFPFILIVQIIIIVFIIKKLIEYSVI